MKDDKKRYSIPSKLLELMFSDENFFSEVTKIKKDGFSNSFPKSDQWKDESGFNISFALAGYSPEDVSVEYAESTLIVKGDGMDSLPKQTIPLDEAENYSREKKPRIHVGSISRGIARRKFISRIFISEEFDTANSIATMEHGLLHIIIPEKKVLKEGKIKIELGRVK